MSGWDQHNYGGGYPPEQFAQYPDNGYNQSYAAPQYPQQPAYPPQQDFQNQGYPPQNGYPQQQYPPQNGYPIQQQQAYPGYLQPSAPYGGYNQGASPQLAYNNAPGPLLPNAIPATGGSQSPRFIGQIIGSNNGRPVSPSKPGAGGLAVPYAPEQKQRPTSPKPGAGMNANLALAQPQQGRPASQNVVPPLKVGGQDAPKDPSGHPCQWSQQKYKGRYICDMCKAPNSDNLNRWVCNSCKFDMCPACSPPPGAPPRPSCPKKHTLKWGVQRYPQGEYICDNPNCKSQHACVERRWICETCKFDLCTLCHPMPFPAGAGNFSPRPQSVRPTSVQVHVQSTTQPYYSPSAPQVQLAAATPITDNSVWAPPAPEYAASLPPVKVESYHSSGRKRALLIGINYPKSRAPLSGCVNDAKRTLASLSSFIDSIVELQKFLLNRGFPSSEMAVMTDDLSPSDANFPNKVKGAKPGDSLWFSFSGHGSQTKDLNGDETDGLDETILPSDYATASAIIDDDLYTWLVLSLPLGCRLTGIMDCCHSGTGMDLPIVYDGTCARDAEEFDLSRGFLHKSHNQPRQIKSRGLSDPPLAIIIAGCEDNQVSADVTVTSSDISAPGMSFGALTKTFLDVVNGNPNVTFEGIIGEVRANLKKKGFQQFPQLSYNVPFNLTGKFVI